MRTYTFSFVLAGPTDLDDEAFGRLLAAGCDDALFGSCAGTPYADFDREARSLIEAIRSAIEAVEGAGVGYKVVRIEHDDLAPVARIADLLGRSRESVRLYALGTRGPGGFPAPAAKARGRSPLYRISEVAAWLEAHPDVRVPGKVGKASDSDLISLYNAALDLRRLSTRVPRASQVLRQLLPTGQTTRK